MKRREFGVLVGSNLAVAASVQTAAAQSTVRDPKLLGTSLTPMGAERVGNEDGSIPAWTGGQTASPLPPDQPVDVKLFTEERQLSTVDAGNMAQHAALLTPGTQAMMQKFGFRLQQYIAHRTAAAPQYVYENTAKNAVNARLSPSGGQTGFTGAYGGVPFPIIDTGNPLAGGAQLIWNHLTSWRGYTGFTPFAPVFVVANGGLELSSAALTRFENSFYDPNGSVETHESGLDFDGYYRKAHVFYKLPSSVSGQESIIWHSTDLSAHPDITWVLLSGQGRLRKHPDPGENYEVFNAAAAKIASFDETECFYGSPAQYDWRYIDKQEMLVPYNCNAMHFCTPKELLGSKYPNPEIVRWEKHRVWVVEAVLRQGQDNALARRRLYIDEDSWCALLGEGYDTSDALIKYYSAYNHCVPSVPAMCRQGSLVFDLRSGDYVYAGSVNYEAHVADEFIAPQLQSYFEPQSMAAICSF